MVIEPRLETTEGVSGWCVHFIRITDKLVLKRWCSPDIPVGEATMTIVTLSLPTLLYQFVSHETGFDDGPLPLYKHEREELRMDY